MCVSELCANAITHSASGHGGVFIVEVGYPRDGLARVAVTDEGGVSVPVAGPLDLMAEGGRGLALVASCTSRWGYADAHPGRIVWAEASWPIPVPSPGQDATARSRFASALPPVTASARRRSASALPPVTASARSRSAFAPPAVTGSARSRSPRARPYRSRPSRDWSPADPPPGPAA